MVDSVGYDHNKYRRNNMDKIKATNPYSKQSTMLTPEEHKLYIEIKEHERDEEYSAMQKKLSKFSRMNAAAYMTLLD